MKEKLLSLLDNPILLRELRRRMRGRRLILLMLLYILALAVTSYLIIVASGLYGFEHGSSGQVRYAQMSETGSRIFFAVSIVQALFVLIIAPLITAGVITNEKEVQTFDFLRVTTISPANYIWGCLISNMLYVLLIMFCALPVIGLSFLFGGVGPDDILSSFIILLSASLLLSLLGLMLSSFFSKTQISQNIMIVLQIFIGIVLFSGLFKLVSGNLFTSPYASSTQTGTGASEQLSFFSWVNFYNIQIPLLVFWVFIFIGLGIIFFIVARRKIFYPSDRALNYLQFFIFFVCMLLFFSGFVFGNLNAEKYSIINYVALLFFISGSIIFGFQQIETGNDLWRLKKKNVMLQSFDEAPLFMFLMAAIWIGSVFLLRYCNKIPFTGYLAIPEFDAISYISQVFIAFLMIKNFMLHNHKYEVILKRIVILFAVFWFVLPLIAEVMFAIDSSFQDFFPLVFLINISPIFSVVYWQNIAFKSAGHFSDIKTFLDTLSSVLFLLVAIYLLIRYLIRYKTEWRKYQSVYYS